MIKRCKNPDCTHTKDGITCPEKDCLCKEMTETSEDSLIPNGTSSSCVNCGHEEWRHIYRKYLKKKKCLFKNCYCKKFKPQTCANCGHEEAFHSFNLDRSCDFKYCRCKKFKPQNHSPQESKVGLATVGSTNLKDTPEDSRVVVNQSSGIQTQPLIRCREPHQLAKQSGNFDESGGQNQDDCIDCKPKQLNKLNNTQKGCGKKFISFGKGRVGIDTSCGYQYRKNTRIHLCKECEDEK